ncbi:MAG: RNA-directed DNA polymerase [Rectinemataceae bacterium]
MDYIKLAIKNVSNYGDTDIFPFPMENALFFDLPERVEEVMKDIEANFGKWKANYPVECIKTCIPVGYTGYRWATVIDPIWNCFLLYQTLKISSNIEMNRIPINKQSVFSYRIKPDEASGKLFNQDQNWRSFYGKAIENAKSDQYSYVIRFDISDFYNRVYHHRLDNALIGCGIEPEIKRRIMDILQDISGTASYGLPVGGNAARILAEIVLNSLDQMMSSKRFTFCRYVDDYIIFAKSREDAYRKLNYCADFLLRNEGLCLQKSKTQVLTSSEFLSLAKSTLEGQDGEVSKNSADFLKLHIHYDPYSATADTDYEELKDKIGQFDILSILKNEVRKSRIHQALGKQVLNAITFLEGEKLELAFSVIGANLENLYPVFPSVMQIVNKKLLETSKVAQKQFVDVLYKLVEDDSYMLQTDNNASYVVRVFSLVNTEKSIQGIDFLHSRMTSPLVKFNCIYAMINLNNHYWLSDIKSRFSTLSRWERRAFIAASYYLKDEGSHWRDHTKEQFTEFEKLVRDWVASKNVTQNRWKIPL